jgi:hypothetical protein
MKRSGRTAATAMGGKGWRTKDSGMISSLVMLSFAVAFNFFITAPVLSQGVNSGGDDMYHVSQAYYLRKLVLEENGVFGVVGAYGLGYPWFNAHQFLSYAVETALNIVSFGFLPLLDAHKLLLVLGYCLFPVGVHYMLGKYGQEPITCGLGALLSATVISGWGHTITAYFTIGLTSQSAAGFLFPFALGSFHELTARGTGHRRTALLYALVLFAHPYYAYFLLLASILDASVRLWGIGRIEALTVVRRAFSAGLVTLLLVAFWLAPLKEYTGYAPNSLRVQAYKESFSIAGATSQFLSGGLLDVSDNFGDFAGTNLRWPLNRGFGRLPVLTALTVAGIAYALARRTRFDVYCLLGLTLSLVLLVGPDDIPLLGYLPLSELSNAKRAIYVFELFAVCLSASSLNWMVGGIYSSFRNVFGWKIGVGVAALLLCQAMYGPYHERLLTAKSEVNVRGYWLPSFERIGDAIQRDGADGRVWGDAECGLGNPLVTGSEPWLLQRTAFRRAYATGFDGMMGKYPNLFPLFDIRYVVCDAKKYGGGILQPLTPLFGDGQFDLYRVDGQFGPVLFSHQKPALLATGGDGWKTVSEAWIDLYKNAQKPDSFPLIAEYSGQNVDDGDYSMLIAYGRGAPKELLGHFSGRASIVASEPGEVLDAAKNGFADAGAAENITVLAESPNTLKVYVKSAGGGLVAYKTTYHPNWGALVDGAEQDTFRVSPDYPAVFIGPGEHVVDFRYSRRLWERMLSALSLATLLYVVMPAGALAKAAGRLRSLN